MPESAQSIVQRYCDGEIDGDVAGYRLKLRGWSIRRIEGLLRPRRHARFLEPPNRPPGAPPSEPRTDLYW
jgi:hypothetical protein